LRIADCGLEDDRNPFFVYRLTAVLSLNPQSAIRNPQLAQLRRPFRR